MDICTFFGHRDTPKDIYNSLKSSIINLIETNNVRTFLVGDKGEFDFLVIKALKEISEIYPINFSVVLSKLPKDNQFSNISLLPPDFENFPPRFAIDKRNEYMLKQSKYVICYINHYMGGSGRFVEKAEKGGKKIIYLGKAKTD